MKNFIYLINLKAYSSATGKNSERIASASKSFKEKIWVVPQTADIVRISRICTTLAQHVDLACGSNTGFISVDSIKCAGAFGSILNHSEHRLPLDVIKKTVSLLKKNKLKSVVCCPSVSSAKKISELKPDFIAIEPPELIGTGVSVTKANPKIISNVVKNVNVPVLCGAGISSSEDVLAAKRLGAVGVLVASAVAKAKSPSVALRKLIPR